MQYQILCFNFRKAEQIARAREEANKVGMKHLHYFAADIARYQFDHAPYDVILFNSSLHHLLILIALFNDIYHRLPGVKPIILTSNNT